MIALQKAIMRIALRITKCGKAVTGSGRMETPSWNGDGAARGARLGSAGHVLAPLAMSADEATPVSADSSGHAD
jgi:hypothetical protein